MLSCSDSAHFDMILIDEEVCDFHTLKELKPKVFLLAKSINPTHNELKTANLVSDVLVKPLRFSVLISCFQETFITKDKTRVTRKAPTLGTLLRDKKILVVDDNVVNRRVAEGALKKYIWSYCYMCR